MLKEFRSTTEKIPFEFVRYAPCYNFDKKHTIDKLFVSSKVINEAEEK